MEKMKTMQVRTSSRAKGMTAKTLDLNGLNVSTAYGRLMAGRGLVSQTDAELIADCVQLHKDLRHLVPGDAVRKDKPVYIVYRDELRPVRQRIRKALENLISVLEEGSAPKYANFTDDNVVMDTFYTIRVPFSGMASREGVDHSSTVRDLLDWIQEIPPRSNAGHLMSVAQLSETVRDAVDVLRTGRISIRDREVPVTKEAVRAITSGILGALATLEAQEIR